MYYWIKIFTILRTILTKTSISKKFKLSNNIIMDIVYLMHIQNL